MLRYINAELPTTASLIVSLCHPEDTAHVDETFTLAMQGKGNVWDIDCRLRH